MIRSLISPQIFIKIEWFLISWIHLWVLFPNVLKSLISPLNSSSDLIKFQRIPKNYLYTRWIRPLFTSILFNLWLTFKICDFGKFLTRIRVFSTTLWIHFVRVVDKGWPLSSGKNEPKEREIAFVTGEKWLEDLDHTTDVRLVGIHGL